MPSTPPPSAGTLCVRPAAPDDAEAVRGVHLASIREVCAADYDREQIEAWTRPSPLEHYRAAMGRHCFVVAEAAGELVGFAELDAEGAEVRAVYVHPAHLRRGVATALLTELERLARERGVPELHLDASLTAEPFYRASGYSAGARRMHHLIGGTLLACVEMRRRL